MDVVHLEIFLAVVREKSFAGAARSLWIAPSRVTERIQQLEAQLRVALFDRTGRQTKLTQAGLALVPRAQAVIREMGLIGALFPNEDGGEVRVGMRSLPSDFRAHLQSNLEAAVGQGRLTMLPLESETQVDLLLTGHLTCGLVWGNPPPPLRYFPILTEQLAWVVPATKKFLELDVIRPSDLSGMRMASVLDPLTIPSPLAPYLEQLPHVDLLNPTVAHATQLMVAGGRHCALVLESDTLSGLPKELRTRVVVKPMEPPVPSIVTHFAWPPDLEESPLFAGVLAYIQQKYSTVTER